MSIQQSSIYPSIIEAIELPRIIHIGENLYAAAFTLMKLLPARYIIDKAIAAGELTPGTPVIETSSGTFALGLAMVCRQRGLPLTIVGDRSIDDDLRNRLAMLGAQVEVVEDRGQPGGIQGARLARVEELRRARPESFVPEQYTNPDNPAAYATVGQLVSQVLGRVDCLVGPVGSGGSTGGIASCLRTDNPDVQLVGVDTHGSIIFKAPEGPRLLRGLGSSIIPGNVTHSAYDEVHWVTPGAVFHATHELYCRHNLFMGPTSGASFLVAAWWAGQHPESNVLMVLPDEGYRYQSTVYNEAWLREQGAEPAPALDGPRLVERPGEAEGSWSRLRWARRKYEDVAGFTAADIEETVT
ncbi:PLP-dependent cysteine synthase family protein [Streptomyces sp. NPDC001858]